MRENHIGCLFLCRDKELKRKPKIGGMEAGLPVTQWGTFPKSLDLVSAPFKLIQTCPHLPTPNPFVPFLFLPLFPLGPCSFPPSSPYD